MFAAVDDAIARLYPTRTWGMPDDEVALGGGVSEQDGCALAEELAAELEACTFFRRGDESDYCDYIDILCIGREPCLVQIRDGDVPMPDELTGQPVREQYLRVCLSSMVRFAGVQQVAMALDWQDGRPVISELPRAGVYDAPLLRRLQRTVAILPAYEIQHVDFGEICAPIPGFQAGAYPALYGGEPVLANYLFYPHPPTMRTVSALSHS